jgi:hypothetical protein
MKQAQSNHYPTTLQAHLMACLLTNSEAFQTCRPILHAEYFDDQLIRAVRYAIKYFDDTGKPAPISLIQAATDTELTKLPNEAVCEPTWLINVIEEFCRFRAMENTIFDGIDLLHAGKSVEVADRMTEALAISLNQRQRFQEMSMQELLTLTTPNWMIPGVIHERQVAMVYGPPDSFKSFVLLNLGSILAHGMMWHGHELKSRPVLYVAAEGAPMMGRRRKAWFLHHELPLENDNLSVIGEPIMLLDTADVRLFINTRKRKGWSGGLVFIDTVSKCITGARESDVEMMSQVIASADLIAKELSCAVILVHHTGWDQAHARGSSASLGNCDAMIRIDRKSDHHATMTVEKQKDAKRQTFEFVVNQVKLGELDRDCEEITSLCAVEAAEGETTKDAAMTAVSDLISIANQMTSDEMQQSKVINLMMSVLGLRRWQTAKRIEAAVPVEWTRTHCKNGFVELRRVKIAARDIRIERRQILA